MLRGFAGQTYSDLTYFAEATATAAAPAETGTPAAQTDPAGAGGGTAAGQPGAQQDPTTQPQPGDPKPSGDNPAAGDPKAPTPTPTEEAIASTRKADALRMAQRLGLDGDYANVEEVETALAAAQEAAHEAELDEQVSNAFGDTARAIAENLKARTFKTIDDSDNEVELRLSDEEIQRLVIEPINAMKGSIRQTERTESYNVLADAVLDILPEDEHEAFGKAVAKGLPIVGKGGWLETAIEHAAPHSNWGKRQDAEKKAFGDTRYSDGFADGAKAPPGTVSQQGGAGAGSGAITTDGKTVAEKARILADDPGAFAREAERLGAHR